MRLCPICRGELKEGELTTYMLDFKYTLLAVRDVSADVYSQCGLEWIAPDVSSRLERIANEVREKKPEL